MLIVPTGYGHNSLFRAATPYGAGAVTYQAQMRPPTDDDLAVARFQGERLAGVIKAMKAAASAEA